MVVAGFSTLFSFGMWKIANREQKARLRPYLCVDSYTPNPFDDGLETVYVIINLGLLPARKVKIYSKIVVGEAPEHLDVVADEVPKDSSINIQDAFTIVHDQKRDFRIGIDAPMKAIYEGHSHIQNIFKIIYEFEDKSYFYYERSEYDITRKTWTMLGSDAN